MSICLLQYGDIEGASHLAATAHAHQMALQKTNDINQTLTLAGQQRLGMVFAAYDDDFPSFLEKLRANGHAVPVVACGPARPSKNATTAIRLGAVDYLTTPLQAELITALLGQVAPARQTSSGPIAGDPQTQELLKQARQFAASDATILLRGESGTGKEVFAHDIHQYSPRHNADFVAVNCAAIPESLLESELFGHKKGAFSGAVQDRIGKFQQANGGTLLLDEISEMGLLLQAKLLRAIQERVIDPVGAAKPEPIDIRLIATTNRRLEDYVAEGNFREDLYFRLNVVMLEIPPLRERPGDILPLAEHFTAKYAAQNRHPGTVQLDESAKDKLLSCYWKGNVRELENTIHRAVLILGQADTMSAEHIVLSPMSLQMMDTADNNVQAQQSIKPNPLSAAAQQYAAAGGGFQQGVGVGRDFVGRSLEEVEREMIFSTLKYCEGNRAYAADILGISLPILRDKLKKYDLMTG